jgi:hypothetical protein
VQAQKNDHEQSSQREQDRRGSIFAEISQDESGQSKKSSHDTIGFSLGSHNYGIYRQRQ